jgi:transposase
LKAFLLRQGYRYPGKANWSEAHQRYLRKLTLPLPALRSVLEEQLLAIEQVTERVKRLDELIEVHETCLRKTPDPIMVRLQAFHVSNPRCGRNMHAL